MPLIPVPTQTAPPDVPNRGDRANFKIEAQAWTLWEKNYKYPETIAVVNCVFGNAQYAENRAAAASGYATAAQQAAIAADAAAQQAAGIAGAPMWVAGNYTLGDYVWSPTSLLNYRRRTPGTTASATDPAADPVGWRLVGSAMSMPQQEITTAGAHQLSAGIHYIVTNPLAVLHMPAAAPQEQVRIEDQSGGTTVQIWPEPGGEFKNRDVALLLSTRGFDKTFTQTASGGWS